jgi:hypothetical protein
MSGWFASDTVEKLCFANGPKIREELLLILRVVDNVG